MNNRCNIYSFIYWFMAWHLNQNQGKNAKHFINLISLFIMMFSLFTAEVAPPPLDEIYAFADHKRFIFISSVQRFLSYKGSPLLPSPMTIHPCLISWWHFVRKTELWNCHSYGSVHSKKITLLAFFKNKYFKLDQEFVFKIFKKYSYYIQNSLVSIEHN